MFIGYANKGKRFGIQLGREAENRNYSLTDIKTLNEVLPGLLGKTNSGVNVTEGKAMGLPSVFSSVRVISEDLASVPLELIYKGNNQKEKITNHYLYDLVHNSPSPNHTAFTFFDTLTALANLWGNAYAQIKRNQQGRPIELKIIHSSQVTPYIVDGKLWYKVQGEYELIRPENMIHVVGPSLDGINGLSMIGLHRETIGSGIAAQEYGGAFFGNGANLQGLLTSEQKLTDEQIETYSKKWNAKYTGPQQAHQTAVLGQGLKYQAIGVPPADAQYIEKQKFSRSEIAGIFRVSAHKINDLEKATFSNIEHLSIEHVNNAIKPWAKRIEQEFDRKLIPQNLKDKFSFKFNLNALMRGDSKSRMEYYKGMQSIGVYSANDIRKLENENTYEGGEQRFIPLNSIPTDRIDQYFEAKIAQLLNKIQGNDTKKED